MSKKDKSAALWFLAWLIPTLILIIARKVLIGSEGEKPLMSDSTQIFIACIMLAVAVLGALFIRQSGRTLAISAPYATTDGSAIEFSVSAGDEPLNSCSISIEAITHDGGCDAQISKFVGNRLGPRLRIARSRLHERDDGLFTIPANDKEEFWLVTHFRDHINIQCADSAHRSIDLPLGEYRLSLQVNGVEKPHQLGVHFSAGRNGLRLL